MMTNDNFAVRFGDFRATTSADWEKAHRWATAPSANLPDFRPIKYLFEYINYLNSNEKWSSLF